jgi:reverse transcriptase-like protein
MGHDRRTYSLDQSSFYRLPTRRKLARVLGVTPAELKALARSEGWYREFFTPKKNGGTRLVEEPPRELKKVQKRIARLLGRIRPKDYLFCPVKGRSYVSNARRHRGNRIVRCLDVRKYFPSTLAWRVYRFFRVTMQCAPDVAEILTQLATFKGHLPTGSPLSPIMAYYAYCDVWERIAAIAAYYGWTLTVYIDDVTISGEQVRAKHLWEVKAAIHACGLRYHKEKCYIDKPAEITGVIVAAQGLSAPNRQLLKARRVRRDISQLSRNEREDKILVGTLQGLRGQIEQIRRASR